MFEIYLIISIVLSGASGALLTIAISRPFEKRAEEQSYNNAIIDCILCVQHDKSKPEIISEMMKKYKKLTF